MLDRISSLFLWFFFVIYKSDVEWPRKDIKDTGPMGVPRSAKNDHFMAPVSQNQRQTVEKARLLNTQSKFLVQVMAGFCHSKWVILTVQIPKNEYFSPKIVIFQQKTYAPYKYVKKL